MFKVASYLGIGFWPAAAVVAAVVAGAAAVNATLAMTIVRYVGSMGTSSTIWW